MSNCVFGPVPSRRLGRSLGIDLVPLKTCTYDCIYCQLGRTSLKTCSSREWLPVDEVIKQLHARLWANPDYITLSGSGEPILYAPLAALIHSIKQVTSIPVAVLTNGSLLSHPEVRRSLRHADVVLPTLAASDERLFQVIHRPHISLSQQVVFDGLARFREKFPGKYWLEVFLLAGLNDADEQIERLSRAVNAIGPGRVQLNTVARPPAELSARPVPRQRLAEIALAFNPPAQVIAEFGGIHQLPAFAADRQAVRDLLARRPCTIEDIAEGLGLHRNAVLKHLESLAETGHASPVRMHGITYYRATETGSQPRD